MISKLSQLTLHLLLSFVPLLPLNGCLLLFVFDLALEFENVLGELFDFFRQFSDLGLVLGLLFKRVRRRLHFLLLELLDQLLFFLVLLRCLLCQMLNLLHKQGLLLVVFGRIGFLHTCNFLLLF